MTVPFGRPHPSPCPDCGDVLKLRLGLYGPFFRCRKNACRGTARANADGEPVAAPPVNAATRKARIAAHAVFDQLWQKFRMDRSAAYRLLSQRMGVPDVHISHLDEEGCKRVIEIVMRILPGVG